MKPDAAGDLAIQTWDALKGASWPIFVQIGEITREAGLTPAQSSLLFVIHASEAQVTPLAAARILGVTPGTITGTLNPLEEMGLIERVRESADRRVVNLRLTVKGRETMTRWLDACRARIEDRMSALTATEQRDLIRILGKLAPPTPGVPEGLASSVKFKPKRGAGTRKKAPGKR